MFVCVNVCICILNYRVHSVGSNVMNVTVLDSEIVGIDSLAKKHQKNTTTKEYNNTNIDEKSDNKTDDM